jgi:hypothetical protein
MEELLRLLNLRKIFEERRTMLYKKSARSQLVKRAIISISQDYLDLGFQRRGSWIRDWGFWILKKLTDIGS